MDLKQLSSAMDQIADNRGISADKVQTAVESALASAYKKEYREKPEIVDAEFDPDSGEVEFWRIKQIVDPEEVIMPDVEREGEDDDRLRFNPERHILLEDALEEDPDAEVGGEIRYELEAQEDFGRIAAQTAKQVILQNVREAERDSIQEEFKDKEGEIVSGLVQRIERGNVYVDLGRAMGIMFRNESIPGERYRTGQRLRFYLLAVQEGSRRKPGIVLSRAHPKFVTKLFEMEVPEIADEDVEIKRIAREPGSRTKIAVVSHQDGIDPVGSVVGQRGARIMAVINELGNEKIDVVEWDDDPQEFVGNAMSPAKAKLVELKERREAMVLVEEDQLSLAIGKGGQNVRLAAKITGWKIDVRSQSDPDTVQAEGVAETEEEEESEDSTEVEAEETTAEKTEKEVEDVKDKEEADEEKDSEQKEETEKMEEQESEEAEEMDEGPQAEASLDDVLTEEPEELEEDDDDDESEEEEEKSS